MRKVIMGNGGFYGCSSEPQGVSVRWKTRVFVLSRSLLLNHLAPQSSKFKLLLPIMSTGIVTYFYSYVGQPLSKQLYLNKRN